MIRKIICLLGLVAFLLPSVAASLDVGVGARFTWDNHKKPVLAYSNVPGTIPEHDINAYGGPNFGGELHLGFTRRFVGLAALDFGYYSHMIYSFPREENDAAQATATFLTFGIGLGAKLYFWEPKTGEAGLYALAGLGKYFAVCSNSDDLGTMASDSNEYAYH